MAKRKPKKGQEQAVRPGLLYAGVAILVAVLAFWLVNLLFLGDSGVEPEPTPAPGAVRGTPAPPPVPTEGPRYPNADEIGLFEGRDPFRPVGGVAAAATAPTPEPTPAPTPAPTPVPPPPAQSQPTGTVFVEVLSVAEDQSSATIKVGDQVHPNAKTRDVLSEGFVVDRIQDDCVDMHRGSEPSFRLCEGERALK